MSIKKNRPTGHNFEPWKAQPIADYGRRKHGYMIKISLMMQKRLVRRDRHAPPESSPCHPANAPRTRHSIRTGLGAKSHAGGTVHYFTNILPIQLDFSQSCGAGRITRPSVVGGTGKDCVVSGCAPRNSRGIELPRLNAALLPIKPRSAWPGICSPFSSPPRHKQKCPDLPPWSGHSPPFVVIERIEDCLTSAKQTLRQEHKRLLESERPSRR